MNRLDITVSFSLSELGRLGVPPVAAGTQPVLLVITALSDCCVYSKRFLKFTHFNRKLSEKKHACSRLLRIGALRRVRRSAAMMPATSSPIHALQLFRRRRTVQTAEMARRRLLLVAGGRHSRRPGCRGHAIDRRRSATFAAGPWPSTWVRPAYVEPDGLRHRVLKDQWLLPAAATATSTLLRGNDVREISASVRASRSSVTSR